MATLTIQDLLAHDDVTPAFAAAAGGGDKVVPRSSDRALLLAIQNGSGDSITVTIDDVNSVAPPGATTFDADVEIVVPAGEERWYLLTDLDRFLDAEGEVNLSYSGVTSLTIGVFRLGVR